VPKSVLIVDDSAAFRKATRYLIETQAGLQVCGEAVNGSDAIEKAQQFRPDLIVLDLLMPVMNGLAAARTLKEVMPTVPIIAFTLYQDMVSESGLQAMGFSAIISKAEPMQLVRHARSLLQGGLNSSNLHG